MILSNTDPSWVWFGISGDDLGRAIDTGRARPWRELSVLPQGVPDPQIEEMRPPEQPTRDDTAELGVRWVVGWRERDEALQSDARALWRELSVLPEGVDPDLRAEEIVSAAYVEDSLVAVSTAFIREIEFLKARFAMFRCVVAPAFRRHTLARVVAGHSRGVLEAWSYEHPEERVSGMGAVVQNADILNSPRRPIFRTSGLTLVGYTPKGEQIRVAWFNHARV